MYFNDTEQHNTPHFHAKYAGQEAVFDFDGKLPGNSRPSNGSISPFGRIFTAKSLRCFGK
ncbi:MAG: DUF4160 domain-containing protein [Oscillospiraceae bacterium]|nr:DUF4160 domain-containing protein [Oscillospiraceae bacterium]